MRQLTTSFHFAHHRLDAYCVARELGDLVLEMARRIPPGHYKMKDQVIRSATGVEALIAEGANRFSPKQKRQRFVEARGEAGEVAAHVERMWRCGFISQAQCIEALTLADRTCAMLTGLIKKFS